MSSCGSVGRMVVLEHVERGAGDDHQAAAQRTVCVLLCPQAGARVTEPGRPEQVALLGAARVVGQGVEERVEHLERVRQLRSDDGQVLRGPPRVAHRGLHVARERAYLVADDRRRGSQERTRFAEGGSESSGARAQLAQRGTEVAGQRPEAGERGARLLERAREQAQRLAQVVVLRGDRLEVRVRRVDQRGKIAVLRPELGRQLLEVADRPLDVAAARDQQLGGLARVARERLEALQGLPQLRRGVALQPLGAGAEQHPQVVARVAVQRGQDLVGVDVGDRVGDRDAVALLELAGRAVARVELQEHVLQPRLRPQQDRGVLVDRRVLAPDLHLHHGATVLELHRADVADLHAGDVHGLALARHDRLRGLELGLHRVEVRPDHRDPRRQVEPLVGQDVPGDAGGHQDHEDDRQEVAEVLADLAPHGPPPIRAAFRLGRCLLVAGAGALLRRLAARPGRARAQRRAERVAEQRAVGAECAGLDPVGAPAGLEAGVLAVAVEVLGLAGESDEALEELLVVRDAAREIAVLDHHVPRGQQVVDQAPVQQVGLREEPHEAVGELGQIARRGLQVLRQAAELRAGHELARLGDPRQRGGDRRGGLPHARDQLQ